MLKRPTPLVLCLGITVYVVDLKIYLVIVDEGTQTASETAEVRLVVLAYDELLGNIAVIYVENDSLLELLLKTEEGLMDAVVEYDLNYVCGGESVVLIAAFIALIAEDYLIFVHDYCVFYCHFSILSPRTTRNPHYCGIFLYSDNRITHFSLDVKENNKIKR